MQSIAKIPDSNEKKRKRNDSPNSQPLKKRKVERKPLQTNTNNSNPTEDFSSPRNRNIKNPQAPFFQQPINRRTYKDGEATFTLNNSDDTVDLKNTPYNGPPFELF